MPIGIAPTGPAGMLWYKGELELARAAKAANIPFTLATGSQTSMEEVAKLVGGTLWFQLYMWSDVRMSHMLVERAKNAGFEALVVTVDGPVGTNREYNIRNGYTVPFRYNRKNTTAVLARPGWLFSVLMRYWMSGGMPTRANYPEGMTEKFTHVSTAERKTKNDSLALGRSQGAARHVAGQAARERHPHADGRRARDRARRRRHHRVQSRRPQLRQLDGADRSAARRSWMRWAIARRSSSTAAFAAAATS